MHSDLPQTFTTHSPPFAAKTAGLFIISALAVLLCLGGCGFSPMYKQGGPTHIPAERSSLNQVDISLIPDREGQILRNELIDRFYTAGRPANPAYSLSVSPIKESIRDLDITKTSDATRAQLRLTTDFTLRDSRTGQPLVQRNLIAITSYNILQSQFTTRVSQQSARQNALGDLAQQIETQLALYFKRAADNR